MFSFTNKKPSARNRLIYKRLPHAGKYVRTLTVHAGNVWEPIRCSLQMHRVACARVYIHYDALSYTWGDPTVTKPIEVEGITIQVTTNLERALRYVISQYTDESIRQCVSTQNSEDELLQIVRISFILEK